jgi:hypothetical protein
MFTQTEAFGVLAGLIAVWAAYWLLLERLLRRLLGALLHVRILRRRGAWMIDQAKPPQWKAVIVGLADLTFVIVGGLGLFLSLVWLAGRSITPAPG